MEDYIVPVRKSSFQKKRSKKYINSAKNNIKLYPLNGEKDLNDSDIMIKHFPSQVKKRKKKKCNSNDNISLFFPNSMNKNDKMDATSSPRKNRKIPKNNNYYADYLEKLYEDEPHFKKSVFKKKPNKLLVRNINRKVSFISPKINLSKQNLNLVKINEDKTINNIKTKTIKGDDEMKDEQSYGYDKKYNASVIKGQNNDVIKTAIFSKKDFEGRNIKRKQTNKTAKSNKTKIRNSEKKNTSINFKKDIKEATRKNVSYRSNDKKFKKKRSKIIKDRNSKDKNNIPKIININNNININENEEKTRNEKNKQKKCINMVENNDKKNENIQKNNSESKNKKMQDLSPKKSTENAETLVQVVEHHNIKKIKKLFCCIPFLICLKSNEGKKTVNN